MATTVENQGLTKSQQIVEQFYDQVPDICVTFDVLRKVGEGTFSKVYQARNRQTNNRTYYALKHIVPTSHPSRIAAELRFMMQLGNKHNVMGVIGGMVSTGNVVMIMPYFPHNRFMDIVSEMNLEEIREYMRNLLVALEWIHSKGVVHRDVKPNNFLYNRKSNRYALVDFGLAQRMEELEDPQKSKAKGKRLSNEAENQMNQKRTCIDLKPETMNRVLQPLVNRINVTVHPAGSDAIKKPEAPVHKQIIGQSISKTPAPPKLLVKESKKCGCSGKKIICKTCISLPSEVAPRAGTPGYRAPEVLMRYRLQTCSIDVWSAGVTFLCLLSRHYPFFSCSEDAIALAEIIAVFGSKRMKKVGVRLGKLLTVGAEVPAQDLGLVCAKLRANKFKKNCPEQIDPSISEKALNLLRALLEPDMKHRISASKALTHEYFNTKL